MSRRRAGLAAAAAMLAALGAAGAGGAELVSRDVFLMGTRATLSAWAPDRRAGLDSLDAALRVLEAAEAELSTWREDSAVSRLNRQPIGRPFALGDALCASLADIFVWHAATAGTFDPAIGRLTDAWGIHAAGRVPPDPILREARAASGLGLLEFDRAGCEVTRLAPVTLDVGAFGKGDALDRAARALGDTSWMIDLGGQIAARGAPPGERGWGVAVAHPLRRDRPHLHLALGGGSLATSGGSERDLVAGSRRVGHVLDPRSGRPAAFGGSVSVWHPRAIVADMLSTALFVMGPDEGLAWAEARGIAATYLVPASDGDVMAQSTTAWRVPGGPLLTARE